jgi:hypothetical protein
MLYTKKDFKEIEAKDIKPEDWLEWDFFEPFLPSKL